MNRRRYFFWMFIASLEYYSRVWTMMTRAWCDSEVVSSKTFHRLFLVLVPTHFFFRSFVLVLFDGHRLWATHLAHLFILCPITDVRCMAFYLSPNTHFFLLLNTNYSNYAPLYSYFVLLDTRQRHSLDRASLFKKQVPLKPGNLLSSPSFVWFYNNFITHQVQDGKIWLIIFIGRLFKSEVIERWVFGFIEWLLILTVCVSK